MKEGFIICDGIQPQKFSPLLARSRRRGSSDIVCGLVSPPPCGGGAGGGGCGDGGRWGGWGEGGGVLAEGRRQVTACGRRDNGT